MKLKMSAALLLSLFVAACAQQQDEPAPVMIDPEPVYDKYGNPM